MITDNYQQKVKHQNKNMNKMRIKKFYIKNISYLKIYKNYFNTFNFFSRKNLYALYKYAEKP